jgi:hypothetical protein
MDFKSAPQICISHPSRPTDFAFAQGVNLPINGGSLQILQVPDWRLIDVLDSNGGFDMSVEHVNEQFVSSYQNQGGQTVMLWAQSATHSIQGGVQGTTWQLKFDGSTIATLVYATYADLHTTTARCWVKPFTGASGIAIYTDGTLVAHQTGSVVSTPIGTLNLVVVGNNPNASTSSAAWTRRVRNWQVRTDSTP